MKQSPEVTVLTDNVYSYFSIVFPEKVVVIPMPQMGNMLGYFSITQDGVQHHLVEMLTGQSEHS